jgi:formate dehydrogenase subunit gamma
MSTTMSEAARAVPPGRVLRYSFSERLNHWIGSLCYIYCLLSGLAFWSPWLFWISFLLGGGQIARMLHPWFGVVFAVCVFQMYRMWAAEMHITENDKNWFRAVDRYTRNEDDAMPPAGKYNAGQKSLFWGFEICIVLLLITGIVMWFPEYMPANLIILVRLSILIHASAAMLTIGLFLIHVYMSVFAERGALDSMVNGDVTLHFARRYHPAWYKELTGNPADPRK